MLYFIFFISGAFAIMIGQALLSITPMYNLWRLAEINALKIIIESDMLKRQSLTILKLAYEDAGRVDEYSKVEEAIIKKHKDQEMAVITILNNLLPYKPNYDSMQEIAQVLVNLSKNKEEQQDE